jgi:large subunit ribosomal protein L6
MTRLAKKPLIIPTGVKVQKSGQTVLVEGPKGKASVTVASDIDVQLKDKEIRVERRSDSLRARALHGTSYRLVSNMIDGVTKGFQKALAIEGVGFRAELKGPNLVLYVGFTHPVEIPVPQGLAVKTPKPTEITVEGVSKQAVGEFAARLRAVFEPEPYKGKGIRYAGEVVRRKAGKAVVK